MRLLHAVAFSKKLPWLAQTKVITSKILTLVVIRLQGELGDGWVRLAWERLG